MPVNRYPNSASRRWHHERTDFRGLLACRSTATRSPPGGGGTMNGLTFVARWRAGDPLPELTLEEVAP